MKFWKAAPPTLDLLEEQVRMLAESVGLFDDTRRIEVRQSHGVYTCSLGTFRSFRGRGSSRFEAMNALCLQMRDDIAHEATVAEMRAQRLREVLDSVREQDLSTDEQDAMEREDVPWTARERVAGVVRATLTKQRRRLVRLRAAEAAAEDATG